MNLNALKPGEALTLTPTRLHVMLTGITGISQTEPGRVTVHFPNRKSETRPLARPLNDEENWLDLCRELGF